MNILYQIKNNKLSQMNVKSFNLEKDLQSLIEDNLQEILGLILVKSEFTIRQKRFDSLCFDEANKSFVIIEYKNTKSSSVIEQGYEYFSLMLNNKDTFIVEFNEKFNMSLRRQDVDWGQSKIIFIAPEFTQSQKNIHLSGMPFELFEIKLFEKNIVSLNKVITHSNESVNQLKSYKKYSKFSQISDQIKIFKEEDLLKWENTKELYFDLKEELSKIQNSEFVAKERYMALQRGRKIIVYIWIHKSKIDLEIVRRSNFKGSFKDVKPSYNLTQKEDPKNLFRIHPSGGTESYKYSMKDMREINYIISVIQHAFENKS